LTIGFFTGAFLTGLGFTADFYLAIVALAALSAFYRFLIALVLSFI